MIPQALTDALNQIDTETNNLAHVVEDLRTKITTSMSPQDVEAVVSGLGNVATRLKGIAADPSNPVPTNPVPTNPVPTNPGATNVAPTP